MRHNIGIYVRVSTEEQAQVADGSIESQQHRINAYIDIKKLQEKNWGKIIDTYIDDGYSAGSTNRPAYQRMIRDLKAGRINLILVTDLSRLSRNISDFCDLYKEIGKYKANFLSIKEQFDTSTPIGEMMVFNMVNLAQFERKQTSERISINFNSRAMRGLSNGGRPLLGYDVDPTNAGKKIVNKDEALLVKKIFEMYDDGQSLSSIAEELTKEKIKRKHCSSKRLRHVHEGRWTVDTVQYILKNHAYIGIREVNIRNKDENQASLKAWQQYHLVPAAWPAIIDEKLFSKVQEKLKKSQILERKRYFSGEQRIYLVSGKIRCGHCGRALVGQSAHGASQVHRYYGHKQVIGENILCPIKRFPANEIESAVIKHLDKILDDAGYLNGIEKNIKLGIVATKSAIEMEKDSIAKTIDKVETEIESVFKLVTRGKDGSLGHELIQGKLQKLAEKKKSLELSLAAMKHNEENLLIVNGAKKFIESNIKMVKAQLKRAKPHLQKKLLGTLFQKLVVSDTGIGISYVLPNDVKILTNSLKTKKPSDDKSDGLHFSYGSLLSFCSPIVGYGGPDRDRTDYLLTASQTLSQMSYEPIFSRIIFTEHIKKVAAPCRMLNC